MSLAATQGTFPQQVSTTFFAQPSIENAAFPGSLTTTFTATTPRGFAPFARVLSQFDPALGRDFEALQNDLKAADGPVLKWLAASVENQKRFAENPIRALRQSNCGISPKLLDQLEAIGRGFASHGPEPVPEASQEAPAVQAVTTTEVEDSSSAAIELDDVDLVTKGWDLIAAVNQKTLNGLINDLFEFGKVPDHISREFKVLGFDVTVNLELEPPVVNFDSSAKNGADIKFPLSGGSIKFAGQTEKIPAGSSVTVTTALNYVDLKIDGNAVKRLSFDFTDEAAVYNVKAQGLPLADLIASALRAELQSLTPGTYFVGDINLEEVPPALRPTGVAKFSTQVVKNPDENVLLLLMTIPSGTPGQSTIFTESPSLIPSGEVSSFTVSNRVLLSEVIVPEVAKGLKTTADNFSVSGTPAKATLKDRVRLGGKYNTTIDGLGIQAVNDGIEIDYDSRNRPVLDTKDQFFIRVRGTATVSPELSGTPGARLVDFTTSESEPKGELVAEWYIWGIVAALIAASFGSLFILYGLIAAIVVPAVLANVTFKLPNGQAIIGQTLQSSLGTFTWPLQGIYDLDAIAVSGDLVISGTPMLPADAEVVEIREGLSILPKVA